MEEKGCYNTATVYIPTDSEIIRKRLNIIEKDLVSYDEKLYQLDLVIEMLNNAKQNILNLKE